MSLNNYDPIELTRLYVFGTSMPSVDDYNEHIRPVDANLDQHRVTKTYDMLDYMTNGGGRYAYPALFGAIEKFFNSTTLENNKTYTFKDIQRILGLVPEKFGVVDKDFKLIISQYGTDTSSSDFADRAYIFGSTSFKLILDNATFEIVNGVKSIKGMEVRAFNDNFDFESGNLMAGLLGAVLFEPTYDPYNLARGDTTKSDGQSVLINFVGEGKVYNSYSQASFLLDQQISEEFVSYGGTLASRAKDAAGIATLAIGEGLTYFQKIAADPFLSYIHNGQKVIYGTPGNDDLDNLDAEFSFDTWKGYFIVGGAGDDILTGGSFADELLAGAGNDTLTGDPGNDYIEGGPGNDSYLYHAGDGFDTLLDSDGSGKILWDNLEIKGANTAGLVSAQWRQLGASVWQDQTNHIAYSLKIQADGSTTLLIGRKGDELRVDHWVSGNLGITLSAGSAAPAATHIYNGDQRARLIGSEIDLTVPSTDTRFNTYKWPATSWAASGTLTGGVVQANFNDVIEGSSGIDSINGLGGNDALDGGAGNDILDGGLGTDKLWGHGGNDIMDGNDGDDRIQGDGKASPGLFESLDDINHGNDYLDGGEGNDKIKVSVKMI